MSEPLSGFELEAFLPGPRAALVRGLLTAMASGGMGTDLVTTIDGSRVLDAAELEDWCCRYLALARENCLDKALVDALMGEDPWPLRRVLQQTLQQVLDDTLPLQKPAEPAEPDEPDEAEEAEEGEEGEEDDDPETDSGEDDWDLDEDPAGHDLSVAAGHDLGVFAMRLRARLQALLLSSGETRQLSGRRGRLQPHLLHRVTTGNSKVFLGKKACLRWDCALHVLFDSSGSMSGESVRLAARVCHALALALYPVPGLRVAVSHFPGADEDGGSCLLLRHGERPRHGWQVEAEGGTPMKQALTNTVNVLRQVKATRKIIVLVTDGEGDVDGPDDLPAEIRNGQIELYGIGILVESLLAVLPGRSEVIRTLPELAPALSRLLQQALGQGLGQGVVQGLAARR